MSLIYAGWNEGNNFVFLWFLTDSMLKELFIVISGFDTFIIIIVGVYRVLDDEM
jgi:hypothetical protein